MNKDTLSDRRGGVAFGNSSTRRPMKCFLPHIQPWQEPCKRLSHINSSFKGYPSDDLKGYRSSPNSGINVMCHFVPTKWVSAAN